MNVMEQKMNVIDMYGCKCNKWICMNVIKWKMNMIDMYGLIRYLTHVGMQVEDVYAVYQSTRP